MKEIQNKKGRKESKMKIFKFAHVVCLLIVVNLSICETRTVSPCSRFESHK